MQLGFCLFITEIFEFLIDLQSRGEYMEMIEELSQRRDLLRGVSS